MKLRLLACSAVMLALLVWPSFALGWTVEPMPGNADGYILVRESADSTTSSEQMFCYYHYKNGLSYSPTYTPDQTTSYYTNSGVVGYVNTSTVCVPVILPEDYPDEFCLVRLNGSYMDKRFVFKVVGTPQIPVSPPYPMQVFANDGDMGRQSVTVSNPSVVTSVSVLGSVDSTGTLASRLSDQWVFDALVLFFVVVGVVFSVAKSGP